MEDIKVINLISSWKVFPALEYLCKVDPTSSKLLVKYLSKEIWSPKDRKEMLDVLGNVFVQSRDKVLYDVLKPILLDIVVRYNKQFEAENFSLRKHQDFCIALSFCLSRPDIRRFTLEYMRGKPSFLQQDVGSEPKKKKAKRNKPTEEVLCQAAWMFTRYLGDARVTALQLEDLLPYLSHGQVDVRWFACQAVMEYQQMLSAHRETFLHKHFTEAEITKLSIRHCEKLEPCVPEMLCTPGKSKEQTHTEKILHETDLCEHITCVGGVLLQKVGTVDTACLDLLPVPSNLSNLHSLAMAVSMGTPVLLQGVVGSGKTTLVEHLARLTGRSGPPQLMKIQLGDQMDSKALLGTYRCTEVPGEFVWQPGVLTQAVTQGFWVLLEDIDYAPMEVISVLLPLLETGSLSIPGHGDNVKAAPGFHLFATQRLVSSRSGWQRQHTSHSVLLDKLWTTVIVEPLSRTELNKVLCTKYPQLETVMDKLLDIYFLLSAGNHQGALDIAMETEDTDMVGKFLSHDGRLISTRDLMTWCSRIARDFDVSSTATSNLVFQEAVDCFVACLSRVAKRMPLAEAIGAKINVTKVKAEYFCLTYKPEIKVTHNSFSLGRVTLPIKEAQVSLQTRKRSMFSYTRQSSMLLERVAVSVSSQEPVLLVGETGTGKTSSVQYLAEQLGHRLHVINMNQQSDSADLLGGFKPVDLRHIVKPFFEEFEILFCKSFSRKQNAKFLGHLHETMSKRKWDTLFSLMEHTKTSALKKSDTESKSFHKKWEGIGRRLAQLKIQVQQTQNALAFTFMEGTLVKAIRNGDWVLLDEINLAAMETLECLSGLLESTTGSVLLMERGDIEPIIRHPDFRLFACMNPATDVGKKDLSPGIRNRFTEMYVDELEDTQDLKILVSDYLQGLSLTASQVDGIVKFYTVIRTESARKLTDGTGHQPHYSLRTLCRALRYAALNRCGSVARSLYEGFCLSFLTQLDRISHPVVEQLVCQHVIGKSNIKSVVKQELPQPPGSHSLKFEGYWISVGSLEPHVPDGYILTPSVRANLRDLARVVSAGQHPVLIQGETSVGKTSLIKWLAESSGNVCLRVNNHEHTDLQEYVGCYAADENGKLVFKEGVLVEAMRKGEWIILDELNLAPTDVLEALNRLLDDNRELYIPETQETIKAHPKFMLFATQNPPGHYGGRKMLSRAFRNRFVELHFDEIPSPELQTILHQRCNIPLSYAKRLVSVMLELQTRRRGSGVFAGKMGFMTLRDLFRWAERYTCPEMDGKKFYDWDQHLADQGYMLLAGRVRKLEEGGVIQEVIQKHFKCNISPASLFTVDASSSLTTKSMLQEVLGQSAEGFQHVVWTHSMRRMAVLIGQAIKYQEPVLLVGETGCGKTTMCQLYAALNSTSLHSVNCHLHTESADFLGGLRPVRAHSEEDKKDKLFEWVDGPLVQAMKDGAMFLIDEISLADDSVLERLNSVLEPERTILLAEKGGGEGLQQEVEQVVARRGFHVFATMNPGGDFGKKELSPALRNRFTEIWCPPSNQRQDLIDIIEHNLHSGIHLCNQEDGTSGIGRAMMDFVSWFSNNELGKRCTVSIRDILTWVRFINSCSKKIDDDDVAMETDEPKYNKLDPAVAYIHGACLVFLDGLGAGTTSQGRDDVVSQLRTVALKYLLKQVNKLTHQDYKMADLFLLDGKQETVNVVNETETDFCIPPFSIPKGDHGRKESLNYALDAPGTCVNAQRVLRALQLPRPLLLEGSPGVGKTSLVSAIAKAAGRQLVRINLSEQTDVTDLFGADLPVEGAEGGVFAWRDGPLLQALKAGSWIVLDELNLASQSVLEGLNACLDHRAEVYIPELGKTFHIQHEKTRLFACQNPLNQGGGRKGLPRSFLNRFTQVYVEPLSQPDLMFIASSMYPDIPQQILSHMVQFNMQMYEETVIRGAWGQRGSPWEFNLRDLFRWCDLLLHNQDQDTLNPGEYIGLVYADRMRTQTDKQQVYELYAKIFPESMEAYRSSGRFHCGIETVQVGHSFLKVNTEGHHHGNNPGSMEILHHCLQPLESLLKCVEMNWMAILVGPPSCGKSSVVEILSQITGNQLNVLAMNSAMDTTELLGGFEQADVSRHMDELATSLHSHIHFLCQHILLANEPGSLDSVARLQTLWRKYAEHQIADGKTTTVEELSILRSRVGALLEAVSECKKLAKALKADKDKTKEVTKLHKSTTALNKKLSLAVPGQGGGAFEWMDSILVKSLQQGHWLLVDNVNFCSASVLDRLNALLEPQGVLSINERGVIDGQIPTIKPHPNFRLFLSMDPRHGEISRAMRNRGVEIYMPGEDDGGALDDHDLRLLLACKGVTSKAAFDWLRQFHTDLHEQLPMGDKPNLQNLLQVCQLFVNHCHHGYQINVAMEMACKSVYIQKQRHRETKQIATTILTNRLEELTSEDMMMPVAPDLGLTPVRLPSVQQYVLDPRRANILKNVAQIVHFIEIESAVMQKHSLFHLLGQTSSKNLQYTVDWLLNYSRNITKNNASAVVEYGMDSLQDICNHVTEVMETVNSKMTMPGSSTLCVSDLPMDVHWNIQMLNKCAQSVEPDHRSKLISTLSLCGFRVHTLIYFLLEMNLTKRHWLRLKEAVQRDKDRGQPSIHAAVEHLVAMLPQLTSAVTECVPSMELDSYEETVKVLDGVGWIRRLYEVAMETLGKGHALSLLPLYWTWFHNKTLTNSLPDLSDQKLSAIIKTLQGMLGKDDRKWKQFVKYWRSWGHPRPFQTETGTRFYIEATKIDETIALQGSSTNLLDQAKVKLITNQRSFIVKAIFSLLQSDLSLEDKDDFEKTMALLNMQLTSHGLQSLYNQTSDMETDSAEETTSSEGMEQNLLEKIQPIDFVQLWPLFEYSSTLESWRLLESVMGGEVSKEMLEAAVDFGIHFTPTSPVDLMKLQSLLQDHNQDEYSSYISSILTRLRKTTLTNNPSKWMEWPGNKEEETVKNEKNCLHHAVLSSVLYKLLSRANPGLSLSKPPNTELSTPLKSYSREITQLSCISRQIWSHAASIKHPDKLNRILDKRNFTCILKHTLRSMKPLLPADLVPEIDFDQQGPLQPDQINTLCQIIKSALSGCEQEERYAKLTQTYVPGISKLMEDSSGDTVHLGTAWIQLGLLGTHLLAPKGPVDPVEKVHTKVKILKEELSDVELELEVLCMQHRLVTGQELTEVSPRLVHPRVLHLLNKKREITLQIEDKSKQLAYRPALSRYGQLIQDVENYQSSIGSAEAVQKLVTRLTKAVQKPKSGSGLQQEVELWVKSQESFLHMLQTEYLVYRDVTEPFICAVNQILHGMHILQHTLRQHRQLYSLVKASTDKPTILDVKQSLRRLMIAVGRFPSLSIEHPTCAQLATALSSEPSLALLNTVVIESNTDNHHDVAEVTVDSILNSTLTHLLNEAKVIGKLTSDIAMTLAHVLSVYVLSWQQREQDKRDKEESEASLYRFKSQEHGDGRSEEEIDEAEFSHNFPQFTKEFADLIDPKSLEDSNIREEVDTSPTVQITDLQMTQITQIHQKLFKHLVQTEWYQPAGSESLLLSDWIKPVLSSYSAAVKLGSCLSDTLESDIDGELLGSHLVIAAVQQHHILHATQQASSKLVEENKLYDIYHDSNVAEVLHCVPVLKAVKARNLELLEEWPDHPTLKQVVEIVARIESLPITAPVMKFLTGMELLLEKAQHWESNAASFVSMATQLADVSALIVQWRKLELSCWHQLFDHEVHRYQTAASKWWFHLYQLIHSVLQPQQESEEAPTPTIGDIIKALKQFMEQSTLGDYPTRLNMLLSFHCHLVTMETVNMESNDVLGQLIAVLWNLHQFYSKFTSTIQTELEKLRAPIEKELKGFVKIARWSDINYWALKQATEKTHRTLHKHVKKFHNVLRQPVTGILVETDSEETKQGTDNSAWRDTLAGYSQQQWSALNTFKVSAVEICPEVTEILSSWSQLLQKPSQLVTRFNKHLKQTIQSTQYCHLLTCLDQFTGEIIEEIHELQALEVNRAQEKAKQKSDAKHFSIRKRKALNDLYKYLTKLGLSYRKGLALEDGDSDAPMLVPPLDLKVALNRLGEKTSVPLWEGCQHYYYRCVARKALFQAAIITPSKELGIANIERTKGFTSHLFELLQHQYKTVHHTARQYKQLSCAVEDLERIVNDKFAEIPQEDLREWNARCRTLTVQMIEGLNQFLVILHCCPRKQGDITLHPSPLPASHLHQMALVSVEDEIIIETIGKIQNLLNDVQKSQSSLDIDTSLMTWTDLSTVYQVLTKLSSMVPTLHEVSKLFCDLDSDHPNALNSVLHFLSSEITQHSKDFNDEYSHIMQDGDLASGTRTSHNGGSDQSEDMKTFSNKAESLVSSLLVALQNVKKCHVSDETKESERAEDSEEGTDEDVIKDGHLVSLVINKLHGDGKAMDSSHITTTLSNLVQDIVKGDNAYGRTKLGLLQSFLPLLHQYCELVHHQLISNIATQRTMAKLLSVLLGVFTDLATKGFCIPPELSDELEGEGATEFCDMENAGMGEGEGVKNVSDQIENEDQLDEAKRPEDHKKEEEENQPDVKSEENAIEMSDDFDGKVQDLEDADKQEDNEEDEDPDEGEEVDKQMGDVDGDERDKLDEQMWGSDEEDEVENEKKEEEGAGDGQQSQPELVAKEENQDKEEAEEGNQREDKEDQEDNENKQPNNLDQMDQDNYDDDQVDPYHGENANEKSAPEEMDLPDDLNLDDGSDTEQKEDGQDEEAQMEEDAGKEDTNLPPEETPEHTEENKDEEEDTEGEDAEMKEGEEDKKDSPDTDTQERQEEEGTDEPGLTPEDDSTVDQEEETETNKPDDSVQAVENYGKTSHDSESVEQSDTARDQAGQAMENDQQETDGSGQASSEQYEGHQGQKSTRAAETSSEGKRKQQERKPGKSDSDRSLGSEEQKYKKLKTTDTRESANEQKQDTSEDKPSDLYEHIKDASSTEPDAQTLDVATAEQQAEQGQIQQENEEDNNVDMAEDEEQKEDEDQPTIEDLKSVQLKKKSKENSDTAEDDGEAEIDPGDVQNYDVPGDKVETATVARGPESTIHTAMEHLYLDNMTFDLETLRAELESQLGAWNQPNVAESKENEQQASELWHRYELLTASLAQDLCEQLRLVLEPSQATKLRGDYRTGKRLNMRKVIPYIASQFRKDKIWLRRTKPSKRQYQIMLAVDDSSSMVDNHSKQMAFESLALISNALTLLEVGQLSICRFGETVHSLHPFTEQFSSQSGAQLLQYLTFEQKKTKIAQLLRHATSTMLDARQKQHGSSGNPDTSQLLVIMSDGRGLFMEGMEVVKNAVRQAREANVFIVFVIIDNPVNKDSILDIKVPVFKSAGQVPEIKSYMDSFPFPFYIILRDINSLPIVLSDALRQWFELVTAVDR